MNQPIKDRNSLTVAVWMVTYNHENYIEQAVESIMMQQTNFDFKLYIGEDFSSDSTRDKCLNLKNKYSSKIELILHESNIGSSNNGLHMYQYCFETKAKYIALCEGDDYWTDPYKLQKQVDFLEANENYVLHYFNANVIDEKGKKLNNQLVHFDQESFGIESLLQADNPICTLTVMFRNIPELKKEEFKQLLLEYPYGDWGLWLYLMFHSQKLAKFENTVCASYRMHAGGVFSKKKPTETLAKIIKIQELNKSNYPTLFPDIIDQTLVKLKIKYLKEIILLNKLKSIQFYFRNYTQLKSNFTIRDFLYAIRKY